MRASTSAGPEVSKIISSNPQSGVIAINPPSVVIAISGAVIPVVLINLHKLFAPGRSFLASTNTASQIGALIKADGSAGIIFT